MTHPHFSAKFLKLVMTASAASLAACQENAPTPNAAAPVTKASPQPQTAQVKAVKPAYDFERQLQNCIGAVCKLADVRKMSMSEYNPVLIAEIGLTQTDTLASARKKISGFYSGTVSSGLGATTDPKLSLLGAQLTAGNQGSLPEYDIVIRTEGMHNGAHVRDWGARIRCAPVMESSPWQTTPCD